MSTKHQSLCGRKSRVWLWATLLAVGGALGGCGQARKSSPGQYHSRKDGFSIAYPQAWQMQEGVMGTAAIFLSPQEGAADDFRENINVVVERLPSAMSLDAYVQQADPLLNKLMTNFREVEQSRVAVGDLKARRMIFTHHMGIYDLKVLSYTFLKDTKGYTITCSAKDDAFDRYLPQFVKACTSFQLD